MEMGAELRVRSVMMGIKKKGMDAMRDAKLRRDGHAVVETWLELTDVMKCAGMEDLCILHLVPLRG